MEDCHLYFLQKVLVFGKKNTDVYLSHGVPIPQYVEREREGEKQIEMSKRVSQYMSFFSKNSLVPFSILQLRVPPGPSNLRPFFYGGARVAGA